MQRSERRTPSWLGGYAERRSISMIKHQNAKERLSERIPKFIWGRPSVSSFDDGTSSKMQNLWSFGRKWRFWRRPAQKFFTPLQAHGMENISAWRGRKFSLATQKNTAIPDKQARSNKILQNKQK